MPVDGRRAAEVALAEGAEGIVVDVAGPATATLGPPEVRALAEGRAPLPAYDDDVIAVALAQVLAAEPGVVGGWLGPGAGVDAVLTVELGPGEDPQAVGARLAAGLRAPALGAGAVRGIDLALRTGPGPAPAGRHVFTRLFLTRGHRPVRSRRRTVRARTSRTAGIVVVPPSAHRRGPTSLCVDVTCDGTGGS